MIGGFALGNMIGLVGMGYGMINSFKDMGGPKLDYGQPNQELGEAAKDDPFLSNLIMNDPELQEDAAKLEAFYKEVKEQKLSDAKLNAYDSIKDAKQEYYDKELEKKLEKLEAKYAETKEKKAAEKSEQKSAREQLLAKQQEELEYFKNSAKPGDAGYDEKLKSMLSFHEKDLEKQGGKLDKKDSSYEKKRQEVISNHNSWVKKREAGLKKKTEAKEADLKEAALTRKEEFFDKFMDSMKDGFTPEANAKRVELVKDFQQSEAKHMLEDTQELMKIQAAGFPPSSNIQNVIKEQSQSFSKLYEEHEFPNGSAISPELKQSYSRLEDYQNTISEKLEKLAAQDPSFSEGMSDRMRGVFGSEKGIQNDGIMSKKEAEQFKELMDEQRLTEDEEPRLSLNINVFKFDNSSFQF
ncbi:MAG: hypothetical protein ABRQ39_14625 [Candidatus Eremiobacterota bacterium]